jgi:aminoglycoside/choline kinase family phosphotransferase
MAAKDSFPTVEQRLESFLLEHFQLDPREIGMVRLTGDASARQFYRCSFPDETSYVLVSYPEPFEEESFAYQQIHALLIEIGIPVPATFVSDGTLGMVLQEDLGDVLLQFKLKEVKRSRRIQLLMQAVDYILRIQVDGSAALKSGCVAYDRRFDRKKLLWELRYFHEHFLSRLGNVPIEKEVLFQEYDRLATELADYPQVFCHRDYQVRNLIVKGDLLFVIDFQDARWGPPAYDLASLLKDSIDLEGSALEDLQTHYLEESRLRRPCNIPLSFFSEEEFHRQFHLMCIQRLLKALGTYGFQVSVRRKGTYFQYIEGTLRRILLSQRELPEFPAIESMVKRQLDRGSVSLAEDWNED